MKDGYRHKSKWNRMLMKNIYAEDELTEEATCKVFLQVQIEGNREVERKQKFYNLDAIISVGYRIKSHIATKFRQWATRRIKEYIVKGFLVGDNTNKMQRCKMKVKYFEHLHYAYTHR